MKRFDLNMFTAGWCAAFAVKELIAGQYLAALVTTALMSINLAWSIGARPPLNGREP